MAIIILRAVDLAAASLDDRFERHAVELFQPIFSRRRVPAGNFSARLLVCAVLCGDVVLGRRHRPSHIRRYEQERG
ncbi:MAG: hypothetical protein KA240_10250, partial [Nitrospira sp.]|nr:hypothetical protein [Nitrospira sp.]